MTRSRRGAGAHRLALAAAVTLLAVTSCGVEPPSGPTVGSQPCSGSATTTGQGVCPPEPSRAAGSPAGVVVDDRVFVSEGRFYVMTGDVLPAWDEAFVDQTNGSLGAARRGLLTVGTGVVVGDVGLRVVLSGTEPPVGDEWEDVVEASFSPLGPEWVIADGQGDEPGHGVAGGLGDFRVRLSSRGVDAGAAADTVGEDEPLVEVHELAFWPAAPAPDEVVRQGSDAAARAHEQVHLVRAPAPTASATDEPPYAVLELPRTVEEECAPPAVVDEGTTWVCARTGSIRSEAVAPATPEASRP